MNARAAALVLAAPLLACAPAPRAPAPRAPAPPPSQSFAEALRLVCDVDRAAGLAPSDDPLALGRARSAWVAAHVENPDAIELVTIASVKGATEQASLLREKARYEGLGRCALADAVEADEAGALAP